MLDLIMQKYMPGGREFETDPIGTKAIYGLILCNYAGLVFGGGGW